MALDCDFETLVNNLSVRIEKELPSLKSSFKLSFPNLDFETIKNFVLKYENPKNVVIPKKSAVLILIYHKNGIPFFVLTKRQTYKGNFSGHICLPGGHYEEKDENFEKTAVRETFEEIGIKSENIKIISELSTLYSERMKLQITPFIGISDKDLGPLFKANEREVAEIIEVPVKDLLDDNYIGSKIVSIGQKQEKTSLPCFLFGENRSKEVWGITCQVLAQFKALLRTV